MALQGVIYGLKVDNDFLPCEISCEISITTDMLSKSGGSGGKYRHYRPGYISWTIYAEANAVIGTLKSSSNILIQSQLDQIELDVFISARASNVDTFDIGGKCYISAQQLSFGNSGFAGHNITFQGTGDLGLSAEQLGLIINAMPAYADKDTIVNTTLW